MSRTWITGVALILILGPSTASASDVCAEVQWLTQERLEMGLIRAQPGATGFVELDPREGISLTNSGATHQGPAGPGVTVVRGPIGAMFTLGIEGVAVDVSNTQALELVELIVRVGGVQQRLALAEASVNIQLPSSGNEAGVAQTNIQVGAVFRYMHTEQPQTANYRLVFSCRAAELP